MAGSDDADADADDARFAPPAESTGGADVDLADVPRLRRAPPRIIASDAPFVPAAAPMPRPSPAERVAAAPPSRQIASHAAVRGTLAIVLAPFAALMPARWRARVGLDGVPLRFGAIASGVAQLALAAGWFYARVIAVHEAAVAPHTGQILGYIEQGSDDSRFALGATGMATFIYVAFSLGGMAAIYFVGEALVRLATAGVHEGALPSGPLVLVDRAGGWLARVWSERHLPRRSVDEVRRDPAGAWLEIASARARPWPPGTVLLVEREAWRVAADVSERTGSARPFVYRFERAPEGHRGQRVYRPDELVRRGKK